MVCYEEHFNEFVYYEVNELNSSLITDFVIEFYKYKILLLYCHRLTFYVKPVKKKILETCITKNL